jgi:hypothetical protein
MKRWIAAVAVSGALMGGGVAVPVVLTAQPASAAPDHHGPFIGPFGVCTTKSGKPGGIFLNTSSDRGHCFANH